MATIICPALSCVYCSIDTPDANVYREIDRNSGPERQRREGESNPIGKPIQIGLIRPLASPDATALRNGGKRRARTCINKSACYHRVMAVRIFYIDESHDNDKFCLSAISIRHTHWKDCFDKVRDFRKQLKAKYGLQLYKEIHARELVRGRGSFGKKAVGKWERSRIFLDILYLITKLPSVRIFNVCLPQKGLADAQMRAWDRMTNRIERTMREFDESEARKRAKLCDAIDALGEGITADAAHDLKFRLNIFRARAFIIADEGRENEIITALRRMHVHNYIPSQFGQWEPGVSAINITTDRIIEDPIFKRSARSHFLQLVDCVAFALLKHEVEPTPAIKKYGIHKMFPVLEPRIYKPAAWRDPLGIVRA